MPSWTPSILDVTSLVENWALAATDGSIATHIAKAVVEVAAEAGDFNPDHIINPSADPVDQVTFGEMANDAAALRAAYQWVIGIVPEDDDHEIARSLHARYVDAVARLTLYGRRRPQAFSVQPSY